MTDIDVHGDSEISLSNKLYRIIIIEGFIDKFEELENRIEDFLNSDPEKEVMNIQFSTHGIKHYVIITYKE